MLYIVQIYYLVRISEYKLKSLNIVISASIDSNCPMNRGLDPIDKRLDGLGISCGLGLWDRHNILNNEHQRQLVNCHSITARTQFSSVFRKAYKSCQNGKLSEAHMENVLVFDLFNCPYFGIHQGANIRFGKFR